MPAMRIAGFLAMFVVAVALIAPAARADDSPGLALAKKTVEKLRGDEHREKMRIVWPETGGEMPPEGAEVALITGYIDYELTRFVWRGGKVEATSVYTARSWFYNTKGESLEASVFDVEPSAFATAWSAARHVLGARDERLEPEPALHADESHMMGKGSHSSVDWIRIRLPDHAMPVHISEATGTLYNWEGVRDWDDIRDPAVFKLFDELRAKRRESAERRPIDPLTTTGFVTDEIRRAAGRLDLAYRGEHKLLLSVCLRVAGDVGNDATLSAVERLKSALAAEPRDEQRDEAVRDRLTGELDVASTKLRLRLHWDPAVACARLASEPESTYAESDLRKWVRRRYREQDPAGYLALLADQRAQGVELPKGELARTLDEVRRWRAVASAESLRQYLSDRDAAACVAAARAVLALDSQDAAAIAALIRVARDANVGIEGEPPERTWPRTDALAEIGERGLMTPGEIRGLLANEPMPHALLVQAVLDTLARSAEPPTSEETLAAWRRTLDGSVYSGLEIGVAKLLDLHDVASRPKLADAVRRLVANGVRGMAVEPAMLAERLAAEMPESGETK